MRRVLMIAAAAAGLSGCALTNGGKHVDVMLFGTTTKLAADVTAVTDITGSPELTIGYKRTEAVWMPLKPSDATTADAMTADQIAVSTAQCANFLLTLPNLGHTADTATAECRRIVDGQKYLARSEGVDSDIGGTELETDTYSVFASFGAKGSIGNGFGSGGLAQIFATGIAAQRLASNPSVGLALSTDGGEAAGEIAKAAKAESDSKSLEALAALADEKPVAASIDAFDQCIAPVPGSAKFKSVIAAGSALEKARDDITGSQSAIVDSVWAYIGAATDASDARDRAGIGGKPRLEVYLQALQQNCP